MSKISHKQFSGSFKTPTGDDIKTNLFVLIFADGGSFIAYCPAIDVYGYGADEIEAKTSFETCIDEFFTYTLHKGTLFTELELMGWQCKKRKKLIPPTLEELISKNKDFENIWNTKEFTKFNKNIAIPACV